MSILNDATYISSNFTDPVKYAAYIAQLLGDAFSHVYGRYSLTLSGSFTLGNGSKTFAISNLGGNLPNFGISAHVKIISSLDPFSWMMGQVTAISSTSITVLVGNFSAINITIDANWTLEYVGGTIFPQPGAPIPSNVGGTNSITTITARSAIDSGDPTLVGEIIFDDFLCANSIAIYPWETNGVNSFSRRWSSVYAPFDCKTIKSGLNYTGDITYPPNNLAIVNYTVLPYNPGSGSYAEHPGVAALEVFTAGNIADLAYGSRTDLDAGYGMIVTSTDMYEICFCFPITPSPADNFHAEFGVAQFSQTYPNPVSNFQIFIVDTAVVVGAPSKTNINLKFTDGFTTSNPVVLTAGVWYRAVMGINGAGTLVAFVYDMAGNQILSTIGTAAYVPSVSFRPYMVIQKINGSNKATLLVDYVFQRHSANR